MKSHVVEIPLESITPDPENLRKHFDQDDLATLAENLKAHGQLDPIQVFVRSDGSYDLWDGERRWRAAKMAALPSLNAIVVSRPSDIDLQCKKISRFMQTRSLTFPEEVRALEEGLRVLDLLDRPDQWGSAAKKLGITPSLLAERMRITKLATDVRERFESGALDYSVSQTLGKIQDKRLQSSLADFVQRENLSSRFAVLQFIPAVLDDPKRSLMESYDLAKRNEKYRYSAPRKQEEVPTEVENRIDEMLEDFRRCIRWLEAAGKQDLLTFLHPQNFNTRRMVTTTRHLHGMLGAFLSAYQARYQSKNEPKSKRTKQQRGAQHLLDAVTGDTQEK